MKFRIARASDLISGGTCPIDGAMREGRDWVIEIASLEELIALNERAENDLIISRDEIFIYDDYME